jgi:hypothetical protein
MAKLKTSIRFDQNTRVFILSFPAYQLFKRYQRQYLLEATRTIAEREDADPEDRKMYVRCRLKKGKKDPAKDIAAYWQAKV